MTGWQNLDWRLRREDTEADRKERWRKLPALPEESDPDPKGYRTGQALLDAANTALYLGKPLLLTGEPGTGKTEFANYLAWRLGLEWHYVDKFGRKKPEYALRFDTKSESRARDLFYTIDQVERFQEAQSVRGTVDPLRFMTFQAMGRAILYAAPRDELAERLPDWQKRPGQPLRSVVLIDEIDKAPRDFPNDLLVEIERMRFFIPELNRRVEAEPEFRPIVVVTSNLEKTLPDAFLRRCVYYNIAFPDPELLKEIVAARLPELPSDKGLVDDAIAIFCHLRGLHLRKPPGTAELLDYVKSLTARGLGPGDRLEAHDDWRDEAGLTLVKISSDRDQLQGLVWEEIAKGGRSR